MSEIIQISNHKKIALDKIRQQYKGKDRIKNVLDSVVNEIQNLEDVFISLKDQRSIYDSVGTQLDVWGKILNQPRNGLSDSDYRLVLLGQVAVNISKGTPEDMIQVFRLFTNPDYVSLNEVYPAKIQLTSVGGSPIGSVDDIKKALRRAAPAGVGIDLFTTSVGNPFVFLSDPDPNGRGFEDLDNPGFGGYFVSIF